MHTVDGGDTWTALPAPPPSARRIRFATTTFGYAWGGGPLWLTTDGGLTWRKDGLRRVLQLETASGLAWALAGEQPYPHVWRSSVGSAEWTKVGTTPNRTGSLDVHGSTAYVLGEQGAGPIGAALDVWSVGGVRHAELPCADKRHRVVPASPIAVSTDGTLFLVCVISTRRGDRQRAYISGDQGRTWFSTASPPTGPDDVAAVSGARFSWSEDLYRATDEHWEKVLSGPDIGDYSPFVLVGFQDDTHGVALTRTGVLFRTTDAGRTWTRVSLGPAGCSERVPFQPSYLPIGWDAAVQKGPGGGSANPAVAHWQGGDGRYVDLVRGRGYYTLDVTKDLTVLDSAADGGDIHEGHGVVFTGCGRTFALQGFGLKRSELFQLAESLHYVE